MPRRESCKMPLTVAPPQCVCESLCINVSVCLFVKLQLSGDKCSISRKHTVEKPNYKDAQRKRAKGVNSVEQQGSGGAADFGQKKSHRAIKMHFSQRPRVIYCRVDACKRWEAAWLKATKGLWWRGERRRAVCMWQEVW